MINNYNTFLEKQVSPHLIHNGDFVHQDDEPGDTAEEKDEDDDKENYGEIVTTLTSRAGPADGEVDLVVESGDNEDWNDAKKQQSGHNENTWDAVQQF